MPLHFCTGARIETHDNPQEMLSEDRKDQQNDYATVVNGDDKGTLRYKCDKVRR
jgi:hypothetical protein